MTNRFTVSETGETGVTMVAFAKPKRKFRMNTPRMNVLLAGIFLGTAFAGTLRGVSLSSVGDFQQAGAFSMPPPAGPNRPANVPDGYVITPVGYFHPSCVQSLAKGERQLADGRVQHSDGSIEEKVAVCSYPHYMYRRTPNNAGGANISTENTEAKTSPEISGYVESANLYSGSATKSYGALIATWTVPPKPSTNDGQVLFFFTGFEYYNDVQSILQPVLQWYQGQWTLASWNCCLNGIVTNSPYVNVTSDDQIYGSITSSCPAGTLSCATWNVLTLDLSTGQSTTLSDTPSAGQIFNWAFGAVLEADNITTCDEYPSDRRVKFENIRLFDQDLHPIFDPKWDVAVDSNGTPQCDYGVKLTRRTVTLEY